jgi:hypothetical protein
MRRLRVAFPLFLVLAFASAPAAPPLELQTDLPVRNWPVDFSSLHADAIPQGERMIEPQAVPSGASHFITLVPCRVLDTRNAIGPYGGPGFHAGEIRSVDIDDGPCLGIPPTATAYSVNLTVANPSAGGWITAWPTEAGKPFVSSVNYLAGETVANAAIIPAGTAGTIDLYSVAATHLIIDINGYFAEGVVTSVFSGGGLAGGGTGAVALELAQGGVDTGHLGEGVVTDPKLATITAAGKVANSATTATPSNVANTIVSRDASGGFAAGALTLSGKLDQSSDEGFVSTGALGGVIPSTGTGTRMMWYPGKGALRAGSVNTSLIFDHNTYGTIASPGTQWDEAYVGLHSVAVGENVRASGDHGTAFGKESVAAGTSTFAAGEASVATGASSVALGYHAHTNARQGTFVFGDRSTVDTIRAGVNHSANWRVSGGFRIFTSSNLSTGVTIQSGASVSNWGQANAVISTSSGAYLSTGGVWTNASSQALKTDFETVEPREILRQVLNLPIRTWRYKSEPAGERHIGPTSQDFARAFPLSGDDQAIGTVDADGVVLAAIQGLHQELEDRDEQVLLLRQQIEELKSLVCLEHPAAEVCR